MLKKWLKSLLVTNCNGFDKKSYFYHSQKKHKQIKAKIDKEKDEQ